MYFFFNLKKTATWLEQAVFLKEYAKEFLSIWAKLQIFFLCYPYLGIQVAEGTEQLYRGRFWKVYKLWDACHFQVVTFRVFSSNNPLELLPDSSPTPHPIFALNPVPNNLCELHFLYMQYEEFGLSSFLRVLPRSYFDIRLKSLSGLCWENTWLLWAKKFCLQTVDYEN